MSEAPRLLLLPSQEGDRVHFDTQEADQGARRRVWHYILRPKFIEAMVAIVDFALIVAASLGYSALYHLITDGRLAAALPYEGVGIIVSLNFATMMTARGNYRLKALMQFSKQAREAIVIWSGIFALLAAVAFTMKISSDFSRGAMILLFVGGLGTVLLWRRLVANFISRSLANGLFARKRIIVVAERGRTNSSRPLAELLSYGYVPVRTFDISREEIAAPGVTRSLQAKLSDIVEAARNERIEDIYLLLRWQNDRTIDGILDALAVLPISIHLVPDDNAARFLSYPVTNVGTAWTATLRRSPLTRFELAAKRCFDVSLSVIGLLMMLPLLLLTAVLIKLDSRGPVLFRQKRDGFNGQTFDILKFRTMYVMENGIAVRQATRNDPRVTRLGRLLRKSSVDELPQLLNVIWGDMSLVGPRPHATSHNSEYEKLIANYAFRHHVKPGLTGWAQVNGCRGETSKIEQMKQRVEHDLWYINNWSPWLDLKIVLQTVLVTLRQDSAY
ncbi:undecaprenyl-phosphate glucose phosphotransferase [Bradyrhizobium sp.]|uniref:undecaprenyl-phosphate glucose phosphotransferase n=1 Tax=Bradyrhizobium sp. TaxID=376 RepID=UPI0039E54F06